MGLGLGLGLGSRRLTAAFSPSSLSLSAWYDPSDLTTLFQDTGATTPVTATGQSVLLMRDKSGHALHLSQATSSKAPTYQVDGSGNAYLLFDGVDDFLSFGTSSGIALPYDRLTALQQVAWTINHRIWASGSGGSLLYQNATTPSLRTSDGSATNALTNSGAAIGSNAIIVERHVANATLLGVNNGTLSGPTDVGATAATTLILGGDGGTLSSNIRFYGAIIGPSGSQLSSTDLASAKTWLGAKCGQTL